MAPPVKRVDDATIREMLSRGEPVERIAVAIGTSPRTAARHIARIKGAASPPSFAHDLSAAGGAPSDPSGEPEGADGLPATDEDIERADAGTLDRWLARAEAAGRTAAAQGNLPAIGQMGRLAVTLQEAKRKATPPAAPDPNDAPDMRLLGAQVAERLHKMVDLVVGE